MTTIEDVRKNHVCESCGEPAVTMRSHHLQCSACALRFDSHQTYCESCNACLLCFAQEHENGCTAPRENIIDDQDQTVR